MVIRAGDVDKIVIPFDRVSSFSQSRPVVKVDEYEIVRTATDTHGFSQLGIKNIGGSRIAAVIFV